MTTHHPAPVSAPASTVQRLRDEVLRDAIERLEPLLVHNDFAQIAVIAQQAIARLDALPATSSNIRPEVTT